MCLLGCFQISIALQYILQSTLKDLILIRFVCYIHKKYFLIWNCYCYCLSDKYWLIVLGQNKIVIFPVKTKLTPTSIVLLPIKIKHFSPVLLFPNSLVSLKLLKVPTKFVQTKDFKLSSYWWKNSKVQRCVDFSVRIMCRGKVITFDHAWSDPKNAYFWLI